MSMIAIANWAALGIAGTGGLVLWYGQAHKPVVLKSRQAVTAFGTAWIAVFLFEFYVLGSASFISMNIDGNVGTTFFTFLTQRHLGGQMAHAYGGGHDIDTVLGFGTQYFSLERILFGFLPPWLANLALKVAVAVVGFVGAYRLCRATTPSRRTVAAALAALFTVAVPYNINATTWNGLGYAVLPWVIYLGVFRENRRHYFIGLLFLGFMASTTEPLHTFLSIAATALAGMVLLGETKIRTILLPLSIIGILMLINWHEVFYALKQIAPLTLRGRVNFGDVSFYEACLRALEHFPKLQIITAFMGLSILALAIKRDPFFWNALAANGVLLGCYTALVWLPWEQIGLGVIKGLSPHYLYFAKAALAIPIGARAVMALSQKNDGISERTAAKAWPIAFVFAFAAATMLYFKSGNLANYAYYGGQSQYSTFDNLADPVWLGNDSIRVVTLRHQQPEPELAAAFYGMDTYDGTLNLTPAAYSIYWRDGILKGQGSEGFFGRLTVSRQFFNGSEYSIDRQADLALLRAANVGFIISPYPLAGGLRLVSGPETPPVRPADGLGLFARDRLSRIFHAGKVYVYALDAPLPRAFAARGVHRVETGMTDSGFLSTIARLSSNRIAIVRGTRGPAPGPVGFKTMRVSSVVKTRDGYDVAVKAPDGGMLVLNAPPMPFWKASNMRGENLEITPVNMVHMAVSVPAGTKTVSFRYQRPTLKGQLFSKSSP